MNLDYISNQGLELLHVLAADGIHGLDLKQIVSLHATGPYSSISFLDSEKSVLVGKSLGTFEDALLQFGFFRIHKSHIVNLRYVSCFRSAKNGGTVELSDGTELPVSRLRKSEFLKSYKALAAVTV